MSTAKTRNKARASNFLIHLLRESKSVLWSHRQTDEAIQNMADMLDLAETRGTDRRTSRIRRVVAKDLSPLRTHAEAILRFWKHGASLSPSAVIVGEDFPIRDQLQGSLQMARAALSRAAKSDYGYSNELAEARQALELLAKAAEAYEASAGTRVDPPLSWIEARDRLHVAISDAKQVLYPDQEDREATN